MQIIGLLSAAERFMLALGVTLIIGLAPESGGIGYIIPNLLGYWNADPIGESMSHANDHYRSMLEAWAESKVG